MPLELVCVPGLLGLLHSGFKAVFKELYGCTDFRGRLAKRGRGRHASANQVIAGTVAREHGRSTCECPTPWGSRPPVRHGLMV